MLLSIIIVNYNVKHFLEHCLFSVNAACAAINAEIIVVDNNSTDGSEAFFANKFSAVKFYWLKENLGFAKACNYGLQKAAGKYILFLNPDTIVGENSLTNCLAYALKLQNPGAIGVRMIDGAGNFLPESKRNLPKPISGLFKALGLARLFSNNSFFAGYYATHVKQNEIAKVPVLAGAFMMMDTALAKQLGGFDESFFMYGEDIDLSYRITQAGYHNYYIGTETILHFKGESLPRQSKTFAQNFYTATSLFVTKHYGNKPLLKLSMLGFIGLSKTIALLFAKTNKSHSVLTENIYQAHLVGNQAAIAKPKTTSPQIKIIAEKETNNAYIFCNTSHQQTIKDIEQMGKNTLCFIFTEGACSLIASSNKNLQGLVLQ
jgi:GT2 family glycosyltransferase